ncbi:MAG: PHP-associated domain-containing protein, partial [Candidatus Gracilibacteria bacterium]
CHKKVIFTKALQNYAQQHGIILISGIEMEINKKHILALNIDPTIEKVKTFPELREYKKRHPDCLIIAPHPFFPSKEALKDALIENIDIFDSIEHSFCYTKSKNYNHKALLLAEKYSKPVVATSDCHFLKNLDLGYTFVNSEKNISAILNAIKKNKITIHHSPISYFQITKMLLMMTFSRLIKKFSSK